MESTKIYRLAVWATPTKVFLAEKENNNQYVEYYVWPECPGDWVFVDNIYLVSPNYIERFKELTQT